MKIAIMVVAIGLATPSFGAVAKKPWDDCEAFERLRLQYPQEDEITKGACYAAGGQICRAREHAAGGWWSTQLICHKNDQAIGGIKGSYQQGQTQAKR